MPDFSLQARKVVTDYIQPNTTLSTAETIYYKTAESSVNYGRWEQVENDFANVDWDEEGYEDFLRTAKKEVEGDIDRISESFIDILDPDEISVELITGAFDSHLVNEEEAIGQREGFQYRIEGEKELSGAYYYHTTDVDITGDLEIEELPNQKRIPFNIDVEKRLITVETTMPARVQKLRAEIDDKTLLEVETTGNLNEVEDEAEKIVRSFIDSFEHYDDQSHHPEGESE